MLYFKGHQILILILIGTFYIAQRYQHIKHKMESLMFVYIINKPERICNPTIINIV